MVKSNVYEYKNIPETSTKFKLLNLEFGNLHLRLVFHCLQVYRVYSETFPEIFEPYKPSRVFHATSDQVQIGHSFLEVKGKSRFHGNSSSDLEILHHSLEPLESVMKCVEMNWMSILVRINVWPLNLSPSRSLFI